MISDDWKLVPATLTEVQRSAAQNAWWNASGAELYWERIYEAMLNAAPQPPVVEQEPVAVVTGYYGGFPTVRPLNPAAVLPIRIALYAHPQTPPSLQPHMISWRLVEQLRFIATRCSDSDATDALNNIIEALEEVIAKK